VPPIDLDDLGGENVVELDHEEIIIENDLVEENGIEEENDIVALAPVDDDPVEVVGERTDHHFFMVDTETCAEETNEAYLEKEEGFTNKKIKIFLCELFFALVSSVPSLFR
jgi:hypothetical protein